MPNYTFRKSSGEVVHKRLSFAQYEAVLAGTKQVVDDSGTPLELVFNPGQVSLTLVDGPSGGWMSKAFKENAFRSEHSKTMARRQKDHVLTPALVPNYKGTDTGTWREAQELARKNSEFGEASAKTYEPLVSKEKSL